MPTLPLAIGILATRNRHELAHRAAHMFWAQDYAGPKRLIVADDSDKPLVLCGALAATETAIWHYPRTRLPSKRNATMRRLADPDAIYFVWDDDDYHGPARIHRQVDALLARPQLDACVFCPFVTYDRTTRAVRRFGEARLHRLPIRAFTDAVIAFRWRLWDAVPWDDAIDPHGCHRWTAMPSSRIASVDGANDYVIVRHATNHTLGMREPHPALVSPAAISADEIEALLTPGCTDPPRLGPRSCAGSRTGR